VIEFLLNQTAVQVSECAPSLSVLDWLRTNYALKGSKEGCASGDCGACTVIIGEKINSELNYHSANACLCLVGQLHGKHLVTVESLTESADANVEQLHPVQRAMVECHGSQCGFCTPGFIMSMATLYLNHSSYPGEERVIEALGGNLCRCTGYKPILDACKKMYEYPRENFSLMTTAEEFFDRQLNASPFVSKNNQTLYLPQNLSELLALKSTQPNARLIAGGTDLSLEFTQQLKTETELVSVNYVKELKRYRQTDEGIEIGASLPYSQWLDDFVQVYPEAKEMFHRLGSEQIRNVGTLGGSLGNASPIGDPAPLLIALNAQIKCVSETQERWLPLETFFVDYRQTQLRPDEVIVSLFVPPRPANQKLACYKVSKRFEDDISALLMVIAYELEGNKVSAIRTGFGGMAAIPKSASAFERAMLGQSFSLQSLTAAGIDFADDFQPMSDVRATDQYRILVCQNLLERVWLEHQMTSDTVRVAHAAI
jgi:xanthine dehydrogenase small subunit